MFEVDGVTYEFHHLGIPTQSERPRDRYSAVYAMYTSDDPCRLARVQWHRSKPESPLHPVLKSAPHPAFKVSDVERAIAGKKVILGPYESVVGYRVAAIEDGGIAVELVETDLSDDEIWARAEKQSVLYSKDSVDAIRRNCGRQRRKLEARHFPHLPRGPRAK
jgi:hypothetical protein